jgi:uncharacterized protein YggT (Ycf19 family)
MLDGMTDPTHRRPESWEPVDRPAPPEGDTGLAWVLRLARVIVLFVYVVVAANLVILTLGFVLRLAGASTDAEFTRWVYRNVDRIMEPFRGMFPPQPLNDRSVFDASLLFAMIIYGIAAIALHALVSWLARHIVAINRRNDAYRQVPPRRP